jgi:hypothetical protein
LAKLRNRIFFSLEELNQAIAPLLAEYNNRPFQELEGSRRSLFEKLEKPALKPLPQRPFEYEEWEKARVNLDYHVHVRADEHYYSVPYRLVHEVLHIRLTAAMVECFHQGECVAVHMRSNRKYHHTTQPEHMPESHRAQAAWPPERILRWVEKASPAAAQVAESILASRAHPELGYRACMGIIRLGQQCGADRLEAACIRALAIQSPSYRTVKEILKQGLDKHPLPKRTPPTPAIEHDNVRGAEYYNRN